MDSFKKGRAFELYTLNVLYPEKNYDVLHLTSNPLETKNRYIKSDALPDIKVQNLNTDEIYWLECKYREYPTEEIEISSYHQIERYKKLKEPTLYIIGFGGIPSNPEKIYTIPLKHIRPIMKFSFINRKKFIRATPDLNSLTHSIPRRSIHS